MKKLFTTLVLASVLSTGFSQTTPTRIQKARMIMEKEIKEGADDPWSYRFSKMTTDSLNKRMVDCKKSSIYYQEAYDDAGKKPATEYTYGSREKYDSMSLFSRLRNKYLDEYNSLKTSSEKTLLKYTLHYRIKNSQGGYELHQDYIYYHLKTKKFYSNHYGFDFED
jgi:hypothetical protein